MKKWLKRIGFILLLGVLAIAFAAFWWRSELSILIGTGKLEGKKNPIPSPRKTPLPPLTQGATDWTCWRGFKGDGHSRVTGIRSDWSRGLKKLWSVDYLCQGDDGATWSAPVALGNRIFVCGRTETEDLLFCLSTLDGALLWKAGYEAKADSSHGAGPRATPCIDGRRIYTFGRSGDVVCWNAFDGKKVWQVNIEKVGGKAPEWGHSSSPIIWRNLLLLHGGGTARTIAFDKLTGKTIWKCGEGESGYVPLVVTTIDGTNCLISFHGTGLALLEAKSGKELWNLPWKTDYDVNATTPIIDGNRVFITSGYNRGCALIQMTKEKGTIIWENKVIASHHSDPIILDEYLYGYSGQSFQNRGSFKCVELKSGALKWSTNEVGWGTFVYVDGYFLCCDIKGNIYLVKPDPERALIVTKMDRALGPDVKPAWTTPVLANDQLLLRHKQTLVAYSIK